MLLELSTVFAISFISLFFIRKIAKIIDLQDHKTPSKNYASTPLIGGIAICTTLLLFLAYRPDIIHHNLLFSGCIGVLAITGAIDDKFDVSYRVRLFIQAILSLVMIHFAGLELHILGNMFGFGQTELGSGIFSFSGLLTVLATVGAINAFNMVDGIDGLLGGLSIVTFSSIATLLNIDNQNSAAYFCVIVVVTMLPFIGMNLGFLGRKRIVFMGDAGSTLIGFTVIWILLSSSQPQQNTEGTLMRPVTALWLIAIPLMDMAAIMIRRVRRGKSPFKPDREHLHHIFQRLGLSSFQTLLTICAFAALFAGFGIYGEIKKIPEPVMFYLFIALFSIYAVALAYVWKVTRFIRKWHKPIKRKQLKML